MDEITTRGITVKEASLIEIVNNLPVEDIERLDIIVERLNSGFYDPHWISIIGKLLTFKLTRVDALAFAQIWAMLADGDIACLDVEAAHPKPDADVKGNNKILQLLDGNAFRAIFWGENKDCDGYLDTIIPLPFSYEVGSQAVEYHTIQPTSFRLEVGYTKMSTSLFHLLDCGRLARWPYGHDRITLLAIRNYKKADFYPDVRLQFPMAQLDLF